MITEAQISGAGQISGVITFLLKELMLADLIGFIYSA